jgi:drug/metabolite transporter (DMT)-like permease
MIPWHRLIGVIVIIFSTFAEALGQFAFKEAADRPPTPNAGPIISAIVNWRWIMLGYFGFIIDGILWSIALYFLDVTVAHPMGSLVFVVVALVSRFMLNEKIAPRRWFGIACILIGSAIVAMN